MKKIIVQGDDFGYTNASNLGIESAYQYGILTETTVFANLLDLKKKEIYRNQIDQLQNHSGLSKPKLGVGIHLNVTYGKPLSPTWPQKEFTRPYKGSGKPEEWIGSAWRKYFIQFTLKQVTDEFRKQIELAFEVFKNIDHLDSHHSTASYEPLKTVYENLAKEYKLAVRADAPLSEKPVYGGDFIAKKEAVSNLRKKGIKTADKYILKLFFNEKNPVSSFLKEIDKADDGETIEVMFHPAKGSEAEPWRKIDFKTLTDARVIEFFSSLNIKLITYKDL